MHPTSSCYPIELHARGGLSACPYAVRSSWTGFFFCNDMFELPLSVCFLVVCTTQMHIHIRIKLLRRARRDGHTCIMVIVYHVCAFCYWNAVRIPCATPMAEATTATNKTTTTTTVREHWVHHTSTHGCGRNSNHHDAACRRRCVYMYICVCVFRHRLHTAKCTLKGGLFTVCTQSASTVRYL